MGDDFEGRTYIILRPQTSRMPYTFDLSDFIPSGSNITTVTVTAYNSADIPVTSTMISSTPTVASNTVTCKLNWPGAAGEYRLVFLCTLDNGDSSKEQAYFERVIAETVP